MSFQAQSSVVLVSLMVQAELLLIKQTSVVTLSVAGTFKELLTIALSMLIFHDQLTRSTVLGIGISLIGIAGYKYIQIKALLEKKQDVVFEYHAIGDDLAPQDDDWQMTLLPETPRPS